MRSFDALSAVVLRLRREFFAPLARLFAAACGAGVSPARAENTLSFRTRSGGARGAFYRPGLESLERRSLLTTVDDLFITASFAEYEEGDTVDFAVTWNGPADAPFHFDFEIEAPGSDPSQYAPDAANVAVAANAVIAPTPVEIHEDSTPESTFQLTYKITRFNGQIVNPPKTHTVTIFDDDGASGGGGGGSEGGSGGGGGGGSEGGGGGGGSEGGSGGGGGSEGGNGGGGSEGGSGGGGGSSGGGGGSEGGSGGGGGSSGGGGGGSESGSGGGGGGGEDPPIHVSIGDSTIEEGDAGSD